MYILRFGEFINLVKLDKYLRIVLEMENTCLNFIIFGVLIFLQQGAWCQNSSIIKYKLDYC